MANNKKVAFIKIFHKTSFGWKISPTGFVEIFVVAKKCFFKTIPQHFVWLKNFQNSPFWTSLPIICWKISTKICCVANFHLNFFFGKLTQQFTLFTKFHKKMRFFKMSTKNLFVEKFQLKNVLFENFHKNLFVEKFPKKKCGKIFTTICIVGKFPQKLFFF